MAWDKADISTDISSQIHATGGPRANKLQAGTDNLREGVAMTAKVQTRATASQVLKQNQAEDLKEAAVTPAQMQNGRDLSKIIIEEDRVEINSEVRAQAAVSREPDSRINKTSNGKSQNPLDNPGEVIGKPSEHGEQMMKILSGQTPASMGNSMGKAERSIDGAGFGGYSNRQASGLGGYEESVNTTSDVDQDHPLSMNSPKGRQEGIEEDRPHETKPGELESGIGQSLDELI